MWETAPEWISRGELGFSHQLLAVSLSQSRLLAGWRWAEEASVAGAEFTAGVSG
jgi:hypothetical protein